MIPDRVQRHAFEALVVVLFVVAEIAAVGGSPDGPPVVVYGFPALWTLPLLLRRRWPSAAVLVVLGALALESRLAQDATESIAVLPPVMLAFWIAGTIEDRVRSAAIGVAGAVLGLVIVAANPGPLRAADVVFLTVFTAAPYVAGWRRGRASSVPPFSSSAPQSSSASATSGSERWPRSVPASPASCTTSSATRSA